MIIRKFLSESVKDSEIFNNIISVYDKLRLHYVPSEEDKISTDVFMKLKYSFKTDLAQFIFINFLYGIRVEEKFEKAIEYRFYNLADSILNGNNSVSFSTLFSFPFSFPTDVEKIEEVIFHKVGQEWVVELIYVKENEIPYSLKYKSDVIKNLVIDKQYELPTIVINNIDSDTKVKGLAIRSNYSAVCDSSSNIYNVFDSIALFNKYGSSKETDEKVINELEEFYSGIINNVITNNVEKLIINELDTSGMLDRGKLFFNLNELLSRIRKLSLGGTAEFKIITISKTVTEYLEDACSNCGSTLNYSKKSLQCKCCKKTFHSSELNLAIHLQKFVTYSDFNSLAYHNISGLKGYFKAIYTNFLGS